MNTKIGWAALTLGCLLLAPGCGDREAVRAINLATGEVVTLPGGEVPEGFLKCDADCTIPGGFPCEKLGPAVCPTHPECRLKELWCMGDSVVGSDGSGSTPPAPPTTTVEKCEYACVPKVPLPCEDKGTEKECLAAGCEWSLWMCPACEGPGCECKPSCHDKPAPPPTGGCLNNLECGKAELCLFKSGCGSLGPGVCQLRPQACPEYYSPTCGCDGQTYGNECEARAAGTSVAHPGDCTLPPPTGCKSNAECGKDSHCFFKSGCGSLGPGVCQKRPQACPEYYSPTCGCDGQTYGNECEARAAGTSVAHPGECKPTQLACKSNLECGKAAFCLFKSGCGKDGPGICQPRPQACNLMYAPVCGCDGQTYGNECGAYAAGVSVASSGECKGTVCASINQKYQTALKEAKACNPLVMNVMAQCTFMVDTDLACKTCVTFVNNTATLDLLKKEWAANGCTNNPWPCPAFACQPPVGATCTSSSIGSSTGTCQDVMK